MARQNSVGAQLGMAFAQQVQEQIDARLRVIQEDVHNLHQFATGKKYYALLAGGTCPIGGLDFIFDQPIPPGYVFTGQRLIATAPAGSKLQIFEGDDVPSNLTEVAANIQEYADGILGPMVIRGPVQLQGVISLSTAEGPFSIKLAGELMPVSLQDTKTQR